MDDRTGNDTILLIQATDHPIQFPRSVTIFAAACAILFSIVGVVGNLVTVIALLRYARLRRHATTAFVISLSVSDLIFAAVNLPLTASRYLNEAWVLGETLCQVFPLFFYGNVAVSLLSMVAITINRYVLISRAEIYAQIYTRRGITLMLIAIWTLSFSLLIPPLLGVWGTLGLDPATFSCTILKKNGKSPKKLLFVVGFLVPCLVIIVSYLCIYWKVRTSRKNLEAHTGVAKRKKTGFQRREDSRVTRLMLTIFLCFLLCFLPLMLANVIDDQIKIPVLHVVASLLAWASSVVNPFIYAGTNKLYREAYRQLLCCGSKNSKNGKIGGPINGGGQGRAIHSHSSKMSSQPT
ncbi:hypothetical protein TSAR_003771 [Trichomalopsis sarcophagae]|uniref:G-protein coupled receptors family 1 profile domain-containing protein n=1 Tax=Trichomalopsis sarcophagae TaxID=543379 RepID=A0A232ER08_9HYME|nr:hypothetical protein TSAR_003771 [Trichomalopsis sarcophagae]